MKANSDRIMIACVFKMFRSKKLKTGAQELELGTNVCCVGKASHM